MTDNEFNVMKLDAMQTELANLIKTIDGIQDAKVMITLPKEGIFVQDQTEEAQASIVITTKAGKKFSEDEINALYTLVSKSVPNLPTDNIVIMDQNFNYYDLKNSESFASGSNFESQYSIKKEIERDVQSQVQRLLSLLMGQTNVVVSVTADIDFTQESREEELVEPVDEENIEGIVISAQRLSETYTGGEAEAGGVPQAEDTEDALTGYVEGVTGDGDYENTEETINYEVNRIRREIVESPYKIRDLGIQVIVEPPTDVDGFNMLDVENDIQEILSTIVRTTIDKSATGPELTDAEIESKIAVSVQPLLGQEDVPSEEVEGFRFPVWGYVLIGILVISGIGVVIFMSRRKKQMELEKQVDDIPEEISQPIQIPDIEEEKETEESIRRKQIEKMAKDRPEEFAKLLRTWLTQD